MGKFIKKYAVFAFGGCLIGELHKPWYIAYPLVVIFVWMVVDYAYVRIQEDHKDESKS